MNKERFHNALALSLGYERIVKDKRITIQVDDSDDPCVTLKFQGCPKAIRLGKLWIFSSDIASGVLANILSNPEVLSTYV